MKKADLHIHTEVSGDSILKPEEIFHIARDARLHAIAFADHDSTGNINEGFRLAREYGIKFLPGIEVYHPLHSDEDIAEYKAIAAKLGLLITGGSDSHGRDMAPGRGIGACYCDWEQIEARIGTARQMKGLSQ